jgi:hypothetical protein
MPSHSLLNVEKTRPLHTIAELEKSFNNTLARQLKTTHKITVEQVLLL